MPTMDVSRRGSVKSAIVERESRQGTEYAVIVRQAVTSGKTARLPSRASRGVVSRS